MLAELRSPVLVIGVGNDLRGDDAAGLIVARAVAGWRRSGVRVIECQQLLPEFASEIAQSVSLVLVDAAVGGSGAVTCEPAQAMVRVRSASLTHGPRLGQLLALVHHLDGATPAVWVIAVPASRFDFGTPLSPNCQRGVADALTLLRTLLPVG